MTDWSYMVRQYASIEYFSQGDKTVNMGEWLAWKKDCQKQNKLLPPSDYKSDKKEISCKKEA